jgi:hypothetical protein
MPFIRNLYPLLARIAETTTAAHEMPDLDYGVSSLVKGRASPMLAVPGSGTGRHRRVSRMV